MKLAASLALASILASGCASATASAPPTAPSPTTTPIVTVSTGPTTIASGGASMCEDTQSQGTGDRSIGTVSGSIASGRILIGIEAAAGPSGTFALAYIDPTGLHEIPAIVDWTTAHAIWATQNTIVFDSERAGDRHLFSADISTGAVTQATSEFRTGQERADVLGDGRIVFDDYSCSDPIDLGLHIKALDGSPAVGLTPARAAGDTGYDTDAAVAPDGHTIVFVRYTDDTISALYTIDASGGVAQRLTADSNNVDYPRWSPDGHTILFDQSPLGGSTDVWSVPVTGGEPRQITHSTGGAIRWEADWAPDGQHIVFKYFQHGWDYNELHLADVDGGNESVLWTGDSSTAETPHWAP